MNVKTWLHFGRSKSCNVASIASLHDVKFFFNFSGDIVWHCVPTSHQHWDSPNVNDVLTALTLREFNKWTLTMFTCLHVHNISGIDRGIEEFRYHCESFKFVTWLSPHSGNEKPLWDSCYTCINQNIQTCTHLPSVTTGARSCAHACAISNKREMGWAHLLLA